MVTLNTVAMGFIFGRGPYPLATVAAYALGGILGDLLRAVLRPGVERPAAWRWFAFAVPVVLNLLYFGSLALTTGLWWHVHLWLGTVLFTGVAGWLLSYLAFPPRVPAALPEPVAAARRSAPLAPPAPRPVGSGRWGRRPAQPAPSAAGSRAAPDPSASPASARRWPEIRRRPPARGTS